MPLKVVKCEEPSLKCFYDHVNQDCKHIKGVIRSLQCCIKQRDKSVLIGKLIRIVSVLTQKKLVILLLREVLPDLKYGEKFQVAIVDKFAEAITNCEVRIGDRFAFFEPLIFSNPAAQPANQSEGKLLPSHVLECGHEDSLLLWYAKKLDALLNKTIVSGSEPEQNENVIVDKKQACSSTADSLGVPINNSRNKPEPITATTSGQSNSVNMSRRSRDSPDSSAGNTSSHKDGDRGLRHKPQIQLPVNPQVPNDCTVQRLHPIYTYKKLAKVKKDALDGDMNRVNIMAVVCDIMKPLSKTTHTGKYTVICKLVDDSCFVKGKLIVLDLHFFTSEKVIIEEIEKGDILRLHRVKMEKYRGDVDGRIFNTQDIVLFKKNAPNVPKTAAKGYKLAEEEKKRIPILKRWYQEEFLAEIEPLSKINSEGNYQLVCKVLAIKAATAGSKSSLTVTDGSVLKSLAPTSNERFNVTCREGHLVTDIEVSDLQPISYLQADNFVYFGEVEASSSKDRLCLTLKDSCHPMIVDEEINRTQEIERRLEKLGFEDECRKRNTASTEEAERQRDEVFTHSLLKDNSPPLPNTRANARKTDEKSEQNVQRHLNVKTRHVECENKSCRKPSQSTVVGEKGSEVSPELEDSSDRVVSGAGPKLAGRKLLFTANYSALSDATDDASDSVVDHLTPVRTAGVSSKVVVTPVKGSIGELIELVKTKYCSPRKLQDENTSKNEKGEPNIKDNLRSAVIKLKKLTDEECLSTSKKSVASTTDGGGSRGNPKSNKRSSDEVNVDGSLEVLEVASTVVNVTLQDSQTTPGGKRRRLDSASTERRDDDAEDRDNLETGDPANSKVYSWLSQYPVCNDADDLDLESVKQLLVSEQSEEEVLDMFHHITAHTRRLRAFLVSINPDPLVEPFDLVSGYCAKGCQRLFLYTLIHWEESKGVVNGFCPNCIKIKQKNPVELMFMMEISVMDSDGYHQMVLVCREHAETFLGCTAYDFVSDSGLRRSRVDLLTNYALVNMNPQTSTRRTPLLDLTVVRLKNVHCMVNSSLKLPTNP